MKKCHQAKILYAKLYKPIFEIFKSLLKKYIFKLVLKFRASKLKIKEVM